MHLGCVADRTGPNFAGPEFSPSLVTTRSGRWLYFSSTGYDGNMDIYVSEQCVDGTFAAPAKVAELSTPADDRMPNVSPDGLEIVFSSNRTDLAGAQGDFDVYVSHRARVSEPWSQPVNLGPDVNTAAGETRPSLSADGQRLYFGRAGDIWMSTRGGRNDGSDDARAERDAAHAWSGVSRMPVGPCSSLLRISEPGGNRLGVFRSKLERVWGRTVEVIGRPRSAAVRRRPLGATLAA